MSNVADERQAAEYLPTSPPVTCHMGQHKNQQPYQLPLFSSRSLPSVGSDAEGFMFAAGGPIWSMDWCPCPSSRKRQYLAVATLSSLEEDVKVGERRREGEEGKGCIQIWSLERSKSAKTRGERNRVKVETEAEAEGEAMEIDEGEDGVDATESEDGRMKCELVLCLDSGPATDVKWMPLGAWDDVSPNASSSGGAASRVADIRMMGVDLGFQSSVSSLLYRLMDLSRSILSRNLKL